MTKIMVYEVGGKIRDEIMGLPNKDVDFAVEASSFSEMRSFITSEGGTIYLETPEYFTIRANVWGLAADFVLCRKDGQYGDGRHPDTVEVGSIYDDLARRDFTMNAIARNVETKEIIDPFGGKQDIYSGIIRCVGDTNSRMDEDSLRLLRAVRFSITKKMRISDDIMWMYESAGWMEKLSRISTERIQNELHKMFVFDTLRTMVFFTRRRYLMEACFTDELWLKPTVEKRK
jgi:tRNA nucleotidyltransferase/poly(A) polymerase